MPAKANLVGQKFGKLIVLFEKGKSSGHITWQCRCDCGNEIVVTTNSLRTGSTSSCGCYRKKVTKEKFTKHGKYKDSTFRVWQSMLDRCYNSNSSNYKNYGGRGIKVYRKWWKFKNFYKDMGDKPKSLTLERIDNDGDYRPSNCKWATRQEQSCNTRAKGYRWNKQRQKWEVQITANYQKIYIGLYNTEEEARKTYLEAKERYHG